MDRQWQEEWAIGGTSDHQPSRTNARTNAASDVAPMATRTRKPYTGTSLPGTARGAYDAVALLARVRLELAPALLARSTLSARQDFSSDAAVDDLFLTRTHRLFVDRFRVDVDPVQSRQILRGVNDPRHKTANRGGGTVVRCVP